MPLNPIVKNSIYSSTVMKTDFEISLADYFSEENLSVSCDACKNNNSSDCNNLSDSLGSGIRSSPGAHSYNTNHLKRIFLAKIPKYVCFLINSQIWTHWSGSMKNHRTWTYPGIICINNYFNY